jgi:glycosyltransferase involved in cell wall biosynthesis
MLSIIVCSRDPEMLRQVSDNIKDTIGVAYEIIAIQNSGGRYGICQAYNIGAEKSKYPFLCFIHEDLVFHTVDWGQKLLRHLSHPSVGLIGVAGGVYKSKTISGWGIDPVEFARMRVLQGYGNGQPNKLFYSNPKDEFISDVVSVDGLWLATKREVWRDIRFDEKTLSGFHFYDLDFSLQVLQQFRVCVIYDILIEHKSAGTLNSEWIESAILFHQKWENMLPMFVQDIPQEQQRRMEADRAKIFLYFLKEYNFNGYTYFKFLFKYFHLSSFRNNIWFMRSYFK